MLDIIINTSTGSATLANRGPIKAGGMVPVRIVFSSNPGTLTYLAVALSADSSAATTAAYLEDFATQNETTHTGWLDANDERLIDLVGSSQSRNVLCEVRWSANDRLQIAPHVALTVQRPLVSGPESSEGGPHYYTQGQIDALFAELEAGDVGLGNVTNDAQVTRGEMGHPLGVATLGEDGKVPTTQLPDSVLGQVEYQGTWDADTNTPDLGELEAEQGWYFVVSTGGATDPDAAGRTWEPGDWLVYNGATWDKIDNTEPPASTSTPGIVQLATQAEANQRRATNRALTPGLMRAATVVALSDDLALVAGSSPTQLLDPGAAAREVELPVIAGSPAGDQVGAGHSYQIHHTGVAGTLEVLDASSISQAVLNPGDFADFLATGTGWRVVHAPRAGALVVTVALDMVAGSAGDDVVVYTPPAGWRGDVIAARWLTTATSGTIATEGKITLQRGTTAITSALDLGLTPAADEVLDIALSSPRAALTSAAPLTVDKTQLAAGTAPEHTGVLVVAIALF